MVKSQRKFWEYEFENKKVFPGIHRNTPSSVVVDFGKRLHKLGNPDKIKILDLGTGNGRNAKYLSDLGYTVFAVDFVANAFKNTNLKKINFSVLDIGKPWKIFKDEEFDAILDVNTTICIREKGRNNAIREAERVLNKGGLYLFSGVERTDWVDGQPGPEINSTVFSDSGKFEKQYTKEELLESYKDFQLLSYDSKVVHSVSINGEPLDFNVINAVFKKTPIV